MTCDQVRPLLEAFAAHELGWGTAWRVRRHLAACPACASELAETRRLDAHVRAWRDVTAPVGLQSRIAATLPVTAPTATPRRPVVVRRTAVGLAGMAAAGVAFFWLVPGQPGQPTIAYADVERAMASVKIMGWTDEVTFYNVDGTVRKHGIRKVWVRANPPAIADIRYPTQSQARQTQSLEDEHGEAELNLEGQYIIRDDQHKVTDEVQRYLLQRAQPMNELAAPGSDLSGSPYGSEKLKVLAWERTTLHGQSVIKFVSTSKFSSRYPAYPPGPPPEHDVAAVGTETVWIDSRTHRVVQSETHAETEQGKPIYDMKEYNVSYDRMPPPGIFDHFPPSGVAVKDRRQRRR